MYELDTKESRVPYESRTRSRRRSWTMELNRKRSERDVGKQKNTLDTRSVIGGVCGGREGSLQLDKRPSTNGAYLYPNAGKFHLQNFQIQGIRSYVYSRYVT